MPTAMETVSALDRIYNLEGFRSLARRQLPRMIFDFIDGGSDDEYSVRRNRVAFEELTLVPRVLRDVSQRSLATTVANQEIAFPVMLAPTGLARLVHDAGELAAARGAARAGTVAVVSSGASVSLEDVAAGVEAQWFPFWATASAT
jgi:isopentenyl diphosphate isomerase/L-lactate dehydrogenase-like FMN-dependent dehydrogenase